MTPSPEQEVEAARLADLRRRLYRPDTTATDVRAYEEALAASSPVEEDPLPDSSAPGRRRLPLVLAVAVPAVLLVGVVGAVALGGGPRSPFAPPSPPTAPAVASSMHAVVEVATSGEGRAQQFRGRGSGIAAVDATELLPADRLELILTVGATGQVRWTAQRVEIHLDGDQYVRVLGEDRRTQTGGIPIGYLLRGTPPTGVRVEVAEGVPWSLVLIPRD